MSLIAGKISKQTEPIDLDKGVFALSSSDARPNKALVSLTEVGGGDLIVFSPLHVSPTRETTSSRHKVLAQQRLPISILPKIDFSQDLTSELLSSLKISENLLFNRSGYSRTTGSNQFCFVLPDDEDAWHRGLALLEEKYLQLDHACSLQFNDLRKPYRQVTNKVLTDSSQWSITDHRIKAEVIALIADQRGSGKTSFERKQDFINQTTSRIRSFDRLLPFLGLDRSELRVASWKSKTTINYCFYIDNNKADSIYLFNHQPETYHSSNHFYLSAINQHKSLTKIVFEGEPGQLAPSASSIVTTSPTTWQDFYTSTARPDQSGDEKIHFLLATYPQIEMGNPKSDPALEQKKIHFDGFDQKGLVIKPVAELKPDPNFDPGIAKDVKEFLKADQVKGLSKLGAEELKEKLIEESCNYYDNQEFARMIGLGSLLFESWSHRPSQGEGYQKALDQMAFPQVECNDMRDRIKLFLNAHQRLINQRFIHQGRPALPNKQPSVYYRRAFRFLEAANIFGNN